MCAREQCRGTREEKEYLVRPTSERVEGENGVKEFALCLCVTVWCAVVKVKERGGEEFQARREIKSKIKTVGKVLNANKSSWYESLN